MGETALLSYAVLKGLIEERRAYENSRFDYFDAFVPFVVEAVRVSSDSVVSVPGLHRELRERFGLSLPQHVVQQLLKRARRSGYLGLSHNIYHVKRDKVSRFEFPSVRDQALLRYRELATALRTFCEVRHGVVWSEDEAESALQGFVQTRQLSILNALSDRPEPTEESTDQTVYLVGAFLQSLLETNARELEFLETVLQGVMLCTAVYFPNIANSTSDFEDTRVYCDTTFLLYALGYAGEAIQGPCIELLSLLNEAGAELACFEHTVEEMSGVLQDCAYQLAGTVGPIMREPSFVQHCLRSRKTALDMEMATAQLPDEIKGLGISISPLPPYDDHRHLIDEAGLTDYVKTRMAYGNLRALQRDVDSLSAIVRLRKGKESRNVEDCHALFLTSNAPLARAAAGFLATKGQSRGVPVCLTDQSLTSLVWLKRPSSAPDLPRKWLIADCFAAVNPDHRLLTRYQQEIAKCQQSGAISNEQYHLLRYSASAPSVLMESSLGKEEAITQATIPQLVSMLEERIREDARRETEAKQEALASQLCEAREELAASRRLEQARRASIHNRATKRSARAFLVVKVITLLLLLAAAITGWIGSLPQWIPTWVKWAASGLSLVAVLMEVLDRWATDLKLLRWLEGLQLGYGQWLERRYLGREGLGE
jgi:hypothetical protein